MSATLCPSPWLAVFGAACRALCSHAYCASPSSSSIVSYSLDFVRYFYIGVVTILGLFDDVTSRHRAHHCVKTGVSVTYAKCPYDNPHPRVYDINVLINVHIYIYYIIYDITTQGTCQCYPKPLHIIFVFQCLSLFLTQCDVLLY